MKQSEKLDLILKALYDYKETAKYHSLVDICKELSIPLGLDEWNRLSHRLKNDALADAIFNHNDSYLKLTSYGIDYCEQNSYTYSGSAIINNHYSISVVNSPNSNIVNQSQNVTITQNINDANEAINSIKNTIQKDTSIDPIILKDILECLDEINQSINSGNKPKFAIKSLIDISAGISSIGSWVTTLGQFAGLIPPLPS